MRIDNVLRTSRYGQVGTPDSAVCFHGEDEEKDEQESCLVEHLRPHGGLVKIPPAYGHDLAAATD